MKKLILTGLILAGMVFSSLVALRSMVHGEDSIYSIDTDNTGFGGGIDLISIDKAGSKHAPIDGILNVNTDRYSEITKKYGSLKYNSVATTGALKHRRAYTYNQADGDSYIITQTGAYLEASTGNGSFTTIISTLSATLDCDFTTANDWLYYTNGSNVSGRWNGSQLENFTVTNSTNYPAFCKYMTNNWLRNWFAGDSRYPNRVYFSEAFVVGLDTGAYENFPTENYIDLGTNDGDTITGLQVWNGRLLVWFSHKCFEIIALDTPGFFGYNLLSNDVGCLYNPSLDILNGMPILLSHRGIEQFNGSAFQTVSLPIDNYVRDLRQLETSVSVISQTSAEDWGAGTEFVNVSTTAISGDVLMISEQNIFSTASYLWGIRPSYNLDATAQRFYPLSNMLVNQLIVGVSTTSSVSLANANVRINIGIADSNYNFISSTNMALSSLYDFKLSTITIPSIFLTANTTYNILLSSSSGFTPDSEMAINVTNTGNYPRGRWYVHGLVWSEFDSNDMYFVLYDSSAMTGSFTTKISTATNWGSWGSISINDTQPTGSSISYYVKTSSANDNFHKKAGIPVSNGSVINSTVGNYIQVISSFSRTSATAIPRLDDFSISSYGSDNNYPQGKVYDERYYLSVNTGPATMNNDTILVMQKNGDWTRYSNKAGCFTVYRSNLYYGDSEDTGFMYRMEVPNLYTDNENAYPSYWTSKKISVFPFYKANMKELWITSKGIDSILTVEHNYDDSTTAWTSNSVTLSDDYGINVSKLQILPSVYTRYFQFRIGNNAANDFRIKRLDLLYDTIPSVE